MVEETPFDEANVPASLNRPLLPLSARGDGSQARGRRFSVMARRMSSLAWPMLSRSVSRRSYDGRRRPSNMPAMLMDSDTEDEEGDSLGIDLEEENEELLGEGEESAAAAYGGDSVVQQQLLDGAQDTPQKPQARALWSGVATSVRIAGPSDAEVEVNGDRLERSAGLSQEALSERAGALPSAQGLTAEDSARGLWKHPSAEHLKLGLEAPDASSEWPAAPAATVDIAHVTLKRVDIAHRKDLWKACQYTRNAMLTADEVVMRCTQHAWIAHSWVCRFSIFWLLACWILVGLTVIELPRWCQVWQHPHMPCGSPLWPSWKMAYLPVGTSWAIEVACTSLLVLEMGLDIFAHGSAFFIPRYRIGQGLTLALYIADIAFVGLTPNTWVRLGPVLRGVLLAIRSRDIRRQASLILSIIPNLITVGGFILTFVLCFAFAGTLFFKDVPHDTSGPMSLASFPDAVWSLMWLLTTLNWPKLSVSIMSHDPWSLLFFVVFISVGVFFLMKLVTSVVFSAYSQQEELMKKALAQRMREHLDEAFDALDWEGEATLSLERFLLLVHTMGKLRRRLGRCGVTSETAALLFAVLDTDNSGTLSRIEFYELANMLHVRFERVDSRTFMELWLPQIPDSGWFSTLEDVVECRWFDRGMDIMLMAIGAITVWESWDDLNIKLPWQRHTSVHTSAAEHRRFMIAMEIACTLLFVAEAALKLVVKGWRQYMAKHRCELLVMLVCCLSVTELVLPEKWEVPSPSWVAMVPIADTLWFLHMLSERGMGRIARMARVTMGGWELRGFYHAIALMLAPALRYVKVLLLMCYTFSCIGVALFGGLINKDPQGKQFPVLAKTAYGQSGYWAYNLNDIPSGMQLFFTMLVGHHGEIITDAYTDVSPMPLTRAFFIAFYLVGNLVCLNIITSFVLKTFQKEYNRMKDSKGGSEEAYGDQASFDASRVAGTKSGLRGTYRATLLTHEDSDKKYERLVQMLEGNASRGSRKRRLQRSNARNSRGGRSFSDLSRLLSTSSRQQPDAEAQ